MTYNSPCPGSTVRWTVQCRVAHQQRRESLGDVRKVELDAARKIAKQRFASAELGTDPMAEKAKAKVTATAAKLTLAIVSLRYLAAKKPSVRPSTYRAIKLQLTVHWKPLATIKRVDVAARLQEITSEHDVSWVKA